MNDSKKRKLAGQKIKDGMATFTKESKELVAKFKRRQSGVKSEVRFNSYLLFNDNTLTTLFNNV